MTRRALLSRCLALGSGALMLASCATPGRQSAATASATSTGALSVPRTGGTLRISIPGDIVSAGAPYRMTGANVDFSPLVYDTLVAYDTQLKPRPRLATDWDWSADARRLTLKLRPGVTFHSGRPFTSADAKFSLEHVRDPALGSNWLNYATAMHVTAPDPVTLVIDYDAPLKSSFDVLASLRMADPQSLEDTNAGRGFVGTGPFRFEEWVPGDHVTVVRNPAYWQPGKPYLDQVELHVGHDPQAALVGLESGSVDWMSGVPAADALRLQSDPTYQVMLTSNGGTFYYVGMDVTVPALADARVRQAFSFALNRPRMVNTGLSSFGRPASIPWPRQSLGYDAGQDQTYTYDLARARQLLEAAGWDTATPVQLALWSQLQITQRMAEIYQADLATIGVTVNVQKLETTDFSARLQNGQFGGVWMTNMAYMNLSPATFLSSALPVRVPNTSHYDSPRYHDLIAQANAATNDDQLKVVLHELTQILLDESFVAPIAEGASIATGPEVARTSVHNATWDTFGLFVYEDIWRDP